MYINVYNISIKIKGPRTTCKAIAQDFSYFVPSASGKGPYNIHLEIKQKKAPISLLPVGRASQVRSEYIIYPNPKNKNAYYVDYHGQALLSVNKENGVKAELWCEEKHLSHELAYLFLQSQIGMILDARGIHRIHACGFTNLKSKKNTIVLIPSGGGKSTLAIMLAKYSEIRLLSDDTPLITREGNILPFPLRLAFTKNAPLPKEMEKKTKIFNRRKYGIKKLLNINNLPYPPTQPLSTQQLPVHKIIIAARYGSLSKPTLSKLSKTIALKTLSRDLLIGVGIPQMAEHMLYKGIWNLPEIIPNAFSRTLTIKNLLSKAEVFELKLSGNLKANAEILL